MFIYLSHSLNIEMVHIILGIYVDNIPHFYLSHICYTKNHLYHMCYIYTILFCLFTLRDILGTSEENIAFQRLVVF
jgi:hypothetical protein